MWNKATPEKVISIVWFSVAMSFCWPLPITSSKRLVHGYKILQMLSAISACLLLMSLLYSMYLHLDNIIIVSKCVCLSIGMSQIIIQTVICSIKHDTLQRIVSEMVTCVREAKQYERDIFSKHIAKCKHFYGGSIIFVYLTASGFLLGPAVLPISFPLDAEYPFSVNYTAVYVVLYVHQSLISYQCTAHICLSGFGALLLWFTVARFECLAMEFQTSTDMDTVIVCINKQMVLKRYAEEVISWLRFVVLYAIGMNTFILILCGIILIMKAPLIVKLQFLTVCFTVLTEVYMYAWPADSMKDMSINASRSAYNLSWYEQTLSMQKNLLNILVYQKPVTLSVRCVLPELTLRYFCSFLSNAFSIFTSLRILIENTST